MDSFKELMVSILIIIALLTGGIGSAACMPAPATPPSSVTSTDKETPEMELINSTMSFIKAQHADAAAYIKQGTAFSVSGTSGRQLGYSWVAYSGGGWTVTIGRPVVPEPVTDIKAEYENGRITWTGTERGGIITESGYSRKD